MRTEAIGTESKPMPPDVPALDAQMTALHARVQTRLAALVGEARQVYHELAALDATRAALDAASEALGERTILGNRLPVFEAWVRGMLRRFDAAGRNCAGASWARDAEVAS